VRLRYSNPSVPGYTRRRCGRGFRYLDPQGGHVDDPGVLERIRALAIPPAWTDVWICPWANGHLQATGRDAAGRLQYRYHDVWREQRDREKFERMLGFARALPGLRRRVGRDLALEGLPRERLLGCATRLLDRGFFRIGGEEYAEGNGTFGLATLQKRHVRLLDDGMMLFEYRAKAGKLRAQRIVDTEAFGVVDCLKRRRGGPQLLCYRNGTGWNPLRSDDVNAYIRTHTHGPHSAKDFRTWHATVLASVALAVLGDRARTKTAKRLVASHAIREVSRYLGNTPTVCRDSYIDPRVFECFYDGRTIDLDLDTIGEDIGEPELLGAEAAVLDLLSGS
jgi:DNA topoisomerase IB